jgi:hypothetical protein
MSSMTANLVGLEWFSEDEKQKHSDDATRGITYANDDLFLRPSASDAQTIPRPKSMQELLQQGLAYDRIALKVRNGTKQLMSSDARRARLDIHSPPDGTALTIAPKWLRET